MKNLLLGIASIFALILFLNFAIEKIVWQMDLEEAAAREYVASLGVEENFLKPPKGKNWSK